MGLFSVLNSRCSSLFKLFENIGSRIQALPSHRHPWKKTRAGLTAPSRLVGTEDFEACVSADAIRDVLGILPVCLPKLGIWWYIMMVYGRCFIGKCLWFTCWWSGCSYVFPTCLRQRHGDKSPVTPWSKVEGDGRSDNFCESNVDHEMCQVPSGNLTVCYWKLPCLVYLPTKNGDFQQLCSKEV